MNGLSKSDVDSSSVIQLSLRKALAFTLTLNTSMIDEEIIVSSYVRRRLQSGINVEMTVLSQEVNETTVVSAMNSTEAMANFTTVFKAEAQAGNVSIASSVSTSFVGVALHIF